MAFFFSSPQRYYFFPNNPKKRTKFLNLVSVEFVYFKKKYYLCRKMIIKHDKSLFRLELYNSL